MNRGNPSEEKARGNLWQLPSTRLIHDEGTWSVRVDRGLGDHAWALLAPLKKHGTHWRIAAPADGALHLARVGPDPRPLSPPPEAEGVTHYACLLRYDYPQDRPGSTFGMGFRPVRHAALDEEAPVRPAEPDRACVGELQAAVNVLQHYFAPELARQLLPAAVVKEPQGALAEPAPEEELRIVFASCQYPAGLMDRTQATASCRALAAAFDEAPPTRLLLLGDQVYTDATYGLLEPTRLDDRYRRPYEELGSRGGPHGQLPQHFQRIIRATPDDHEFRDNWEPDPQRPADRPLDRGLRAYWAHQRGLPEAKAAQNARSAAPLWRTEAGVLADGARWRLFIADSRTAREPRDEDSVHRALLLGERQTVDLMRWLLEAPRDELKVVTTAAMLLPRTRLYVDEPLHQDGWQGYPASLYSLLVHLCENEMRNVVFLSGDMHLACNARVTVTHPDSGKSCVFESHHAPPLYAPYPFANESRHGLLLHDAFDFTWRHGEQERRYRCRVDATVPDETFQGYALLRAKPALGGWETEVEVTSSREA